jgi:GH18 family chitinase
MAIPWSKYTHVIQYAALPTDGCALDTGSYLITPASITAFTSAAHANGVKALIGLMQDNDASLMKKCTDAGHVAGFAANLAGFVRANGYDGFDFDWENGIIPSQYTDLISRLRALLPLMVVTVATDVSSRSMLATIQGDIDQINIMNYDSDTGFFTGTVPTTTWFNSAILAAGETTRVSAEGSINFMLSAGIAAGKIGVGQPFYARVTQGCRAGYQSGTSCGQGVTGPNQPFASGNAATNSRAAINYNALLSSRYWSGGKQLWDDDHKSAYISYYSNNATCSPPPCNADAYVSYPDPRQLQSVIDLVNSKRLGGLMVFSLEGEYLPAASGDARYPLSSVIAPSEMPQPPSSVTTTH